MTEPTAEPPEERIKEETLEGPSIALRQKRSQDLRGLSPLGGGYPANPGNFGVVSFAGAPTSVIPPPALELNNMIHSIRGTISNDISKIIKA